MKESDRLHIAAHIGLDLLFASATAVFTGLTICCDDPEKNKKDSKEFSCFFHDIKDTKFLLSKNLFVGFSVLGFSWEE